VSIRSRLAIAVALVLLITFGVLGVVLVRSTRATLVNQVDQQLLTSVDRAKGDGGPPDHGKGNPWINGALGKPSTNLTAYDERVVGFYFYDSSGTLVDELACGYPDSPKSPPKVSSDTFNLLANKITTTPSEDSKLSYRILVTKQPDGAVQVTAATLESVDQAVSRLARIFLIAGAIAMIATTAIAYGLIRRGLRPVDRMVEVASEIAGGNLSLRVPEANPRTELGQLGGALNNMLHRIEDAVRARTASEERLRRFIGDAAHELRTPLTSVRGYAELYRAGAISDAAGVENAMRRIEAEGSRMARLVDEKLLLARLDQQRGLEMKPVDVVAIAREALADFAAVDPERPLTSDLAPIAMVNGDRIRLRQVIDNLMANARIHTPAGTPIRLGVAVEGKNAAITVTDRGAGIAPEDLERVFERFWRADPARARNRGGSGLGLSIVSSLVESHGGTVSVESQPGRGTTFSVRLPLLSAAP